MNSKRNIEQADFCTHPDGTTVQLYTLTNANGMKAQITNFGGIVVSLTAPDRDGNFADVVLGYEDPTHYFETGPYFGALIGRYGNRIANGRFTLDGTTYSLARNDEANHLHGGVVGFDKRCWHAVADVCDEGPQLTLDYVSPDGEEGYPGTLTVRCRYVLTDDNSLRIAYEATTDRPTVINLTHHSYFNLAGAGDILDHELQLNAEAFTPIDETQIPLGHFEPVEGTPFDFRKPCPIGARIEGDHPQLKAGLGYDHNWVVQDGTKGWTCQGKVYEPKSGRVLEVYSTAPGLQFYSGNVLDGTIHGKGGVRYGMRSGFCLEPQHAPDSPNQPSFPSTVLRPGERYTHTLGYTFSSR